MKPFRLFLLILILLTGIALIVILFVRKTSTPLESSLVPLFQIAGEPVKAVDVVATKILPIDQNDEKEFGRNIAAYYSGVTDTADARSQYVNAILQSISSKNKSKFTYKAFILDYYDPNACAFPGGVILVTAGLFDILEDEGQLVSVLAHEMGHIECGHCMQAAKFEILTKKINTPEVGEFADWLNALLLRHAYSKTQEADADAFAFKTLLQTQYSPSSEADAFFALLNYEARESGNGSEHSDADVIRDYFMSHPPLQLRANKYSVEAQQWWKVNPVAKKYTGKKNLTQRVTLNSQSWDDEWVVGVQARLVNATR